MRGGRRGDPVLVALRDALRIYILQHLSKFPQSWLSALDLARVIHEQYIVDERSWNGQVPLRHKEVIAMLRELAEDGEVECRESPARAGFWQWRRAA